MVSSSWLALSHESVLVVHPTALKLSVNVRWVEGSVPTRRVVHVHTMEKCCLITWQLGLSQPVETLRGNPGKVAIDAGDSYPLPNSPSPVLEHGRHWGQPSALTQH